MGESKQGDGSQAGVAEDNFAEIFRCWITVKGGLNVGGEMFAHERNFFEKSQRQIGGLLGSGFLTAIFGVTNGSENLRAKPVVKLVDQVPYMIQSVVLIQLLMTPIARKGEFVEVFYDFDHFTITR